MSNIKISIYDPSVEAHREVSVEDYKKQLASLGLTEKEIEKKVAKAIGPQKEQWKELSKEFKK